MEELFASTECCGYGYDLHSGSSTDIRSIDLIRQLLLADVVPAIRCLQRELIHREPQIPALDAHRVGPLDQRAARKRLDLDVARRNHAFHAGLQAVERGVRSQTRQRGVEVRDRVLLRGADVHAALVVGCVAFGVGAGLAEGLDVREDLGVGEAGVY